MDINDIAGLHESIAQAMHGAFDKPRTPPQTYYPSRIERVRRESYLGDSTAGALPPIYPDPDDASEPPSVKQTADSSGTASVRLCDGSTLTCVGTITPP